MKKYKKICCAVLFLGSFVFAQTEDEEAINLPDVSTVISGGAPKAGKSAVPDYSVVLPKLSDSEIVPRLPEPGEQEKVNGDSRIFQDTNQKTIYAEGRAGLGFPGLFSGKFSIYRESGSNPFRINFGHETVNGYSGHDFTSGYFDRNTEIDAEKLFTTEKLSLRLNGSYESIANGLQKKISNISDITNETMMAGTDLKVDFNDVFGLKASLNGSWYNRYGTVSSKTMSIPDPNNIVSTIKMQDFAESISVFDLNPSVILGFNYKGFYTDFDLGYFWTYDAGKDFSRHNTNRFDFGVLFGWKNDFTNIYGNASCVCGNGINDNKVVVPFTVGSDFTFGTSLSSRKVRMSLAGGIESYLPKISELEKQYKFSALSVLPEETSNWYGKFDVNLPLKDIFTFTAGAEFKTTAFDNGTYEAVYEDKSYYFGQYLYDQDEITQFNTEVGAVVRYGLAIFSAGWKAFWGDVPVCDDQSVFNFGLNLQDKKSRITFDSETAIALGEGADSVPKVDFEICFKASDACRLAVNGTDIIKLAGSGERDYNGKYIERSGTIGMFVKFFF